MASGNGGSGDRTKLPSNVIRLGTETLYAIADELRRMYDADLRSRPSQDLERLIQRIERGDISGQTKKPGKGEPPS
jgi:HAMP domain-containing protein